LPDIDSPDDALCGLLPVLFVCGMNGADRLFCIETVPHAAKVRKTDPVVNGIVNLYSAATQANDTHSDTAGIHRMNPAILLYRQRPDYRRGGKIFIRV
jgi:hypothetical protein